MELKNPFVKSIVEKTAQEQFKELGVNFFTDDFFRQRTLNIDSDLETFLADEEIDVMLLTETRKAVLKMLARRLRYFMHQVPFAKIRNDVRMAKAMSGVRKLLFMDYKLIMSSADDRVVAKICMEDFSKVDVFVGLTFDEQNTSINKSFMTPPMPVQFQQQHNIPPERESSNDKLSKIALKQREIREQESQQTEANQG